MALFESYDRRINQINAVLNNYGIKDIEDAKAICDAQGIDPYKMCKDIQPIAFENAAWAYVVGAAIAIKKGCKKAAEAAEAIGEGLQSFCIPGSVAADRKVGLGHGNLAAMLLREETKCFAFLAGHESFAAAEGAIGIAKSANKVRQQPLKVILNGLGKDAAMIISRINGFTYVQTEFDYYTGELKIVKEKAYSKGERAQVRCYGADDVREGVASCATRESTFPSPETQPTRPASNTRLPEHTRKSVWKPEKNTSQLPPVVVPDVPFTRITWQPDRLATVSPTRLAVCTVTHNSQVHPPFPHTWK